MIAKDTAQIKNIISKRTKNITENVVKLLNRGALLVEGTAKESIQRGAKTGRTYRRGGITHQASAAGEAPASDTGFLVSNITHNLATKGQTMTAKVLSNAKYSKFLEYGTRKMEERPFLQPALEQNKKKIKDFFKKGGLIK